MKKYAWLLGLLAALFAGCGSNSPQMGSMEGVQQGEAALQAEGGALVDEALSSFGDLMPASTQGLRPQAVSPRPLTIIRDREGFTILSRPPWPADASLEGMVNRPVFLTIKHKSYPPRPQAYLGILRQGTNGYEIEWYGQMENGRRLSSRSPLQVERVRQDGVAPGVPCWGQPLVSWKKWGNYYVFDGCMPIDRIHVSGTFPIDLPGHPLERTLNASPIEDPFRTLYNGLTKPFDVEWPPALLMREHVVLAIAPYRNPRLQNARSIEEILGEELALAYLRSTDGERLTEREKGRALSLKLIWEDPKYTLVARDLNTREEIRFRIAEVSWCDGCWFPGMPSGIYLGIEDRLSGPPVLHLQVGPLLLQGIEKK